MPTPSVHLFSTGRGLDKTRFRDTRLHNRLSILDAILDKKFTGWLPIWVALIQHPEGNFLVDTGIDPAINDPTYFKSSGFLVDRYLRTQFVFEPNAENPLHRQLAAANLLPDTIILTHLHFDHTGGLAQFPKTPILLNRTEWQHPFATLPKLYPENFRPTLIDLDTPYNTFPKTRSLTSDHRILLVHTPGHTKGHCSVLVRTDTTNILLAGDICYNKRQLEKDKFAANLASYSAAKNTYNKIKEFSRQQPFLFIASHDPEAPAILESASH